MHEGEASYWKIIVNRSKINQARVGSEHWHEWVRYGREVSIGAKGTK